MEWKLRDRITLSEIFQCSKCFKKFHNFPIFQFSNASLFMQTDVESKQEAKRGSRLHTNCSPWPANICSVNFPLKPKNLRRFVAVALRKVGKNRCSLSKMASRVRKKRRRTGTHTLLPAPTAAS